MQQPPNRGTRPLTPGKTTPFGDAFVSSSQAMPGTGSLKAPTGPLTHAVPLKIEEVRSGLDYIRGLSSIFDASVMVMRYALHLSAMNPMPSRIPTGEELADEGLPGDEPAADQEPDAERIEHPEGPWSRLQDADKNLALEVAGIIRANPRLKQRVQVVVVQYDDAMQGYRQAGKLLQGIERVPLEEAWERLQEIGIERLKGKAYVITGFWDNFKNDPVLCTVFPPPAKKQSGPLPPVDEEETEEEQTGGFLGKLKGLFGR